VGGRGVKNLKGILVLLSLFVFMFMFAGTVSAANNTTPYVSSIDPSNNAVNVAADKMIKVTFTENMTQHNNWTDLKDNNGVSIPINTSLNGNILTITHTTLLTHGLVYT
jgi:hypothetical protein